MANIREVNKAIKSEFPALDIEVVRGEGYLYFDGDDGFDVVDSVYTHPTSTSTATAIRLCIASIRDVFGGEA